MKEYTPFKSGKVREVYDAGDSIIMVATDRISAFDHILKNKITKKGAILTQMSKFWFDMTIIPMECIVRGYITGSGWESYQQNGTVCGIKLPAGLTES